MNEPLINFREYRHLVGQTIHRLGGYRGLADQLGPLGDRIEAALAAADTAEPSTHAHLGHFSVECSTCMDARRRPAGYVEPQQAAAPIQNIEDTHMELGVDGFARTVDADAAAAAAASTGGSAVEWLAHAKFGLQSLSDLYHDGGKDGRGITVKEFRAGIDFVWEQIEAARLVIDHCDGREWCVLPFRHSGGHRSSVAGSPPLSDVCQCPIEEVNYDRCPSCPHRAHSADACRGGPAIEVPPGPPDPPKRLYPDPRG